MAPEEEKAADHLHLQLCMLDGYVGQFCSALALFEHCGDLVHSAVASYNWEDMDSRGWPHIAARDAALTVYHFGKLLTGIKRQMRACPTLRMHFDKANMRIARKLYDSQFRQAEDIRHAISHTAEMLQTPGTLKRHQGTERIFVINSIMNRRFDTTFNGERLSFEMTEATLKKLDRVRALVFESLRPVELALQPTRKSA